MKKNVKTLIAMLAMLLVLFAGTAAMADIIQYDLAQEGPGSIDLHVSVDRRITRTEQERDCSFVASFNFHAGPAVLHQIREQAQAGNDIELVYDLSSFIAQTPLGNITDKNGVLYVGGVRVGTYSVQGNKVILKPNRSYLEHASDFRGNFELSMHTDAAELGLQDQYTYHFPGTPNPESVTIKYKKVTFSSTKTVNGGSVTDGREVEVTPNADGTYTLNYSVTMNTNATMKDLTFSDVLGGNQQLNRSSVTVNGHPATPAVDGQSFSVDVRAALGTETVGPGSFTVNYSTTLTEEQLGTPFAYPTLVCSTPFTIEKKCSTPQKHPPAK